MSGAPAGALNPSAGPVAPGSVIRVAAATAAAAVCGYVVLYLAARSLGPAGFAMFAVFWGAFGPRRAIPPTHLKRAGGP